MSIRQTRYKSPSHSFSARTLFGAVNEFFRHSIFNFDAECYTRPLLGNPFAARRQMHIWPDKTDVYEHDGPGDRGDAIFLGLMEMLRGRVTPDDSVFDVGCNSGYFLQKFHENGFRDLTGLDPQRSAVEHMRRHRPYIKAVLGYFGEAGRDVAADLVTFFSSIDRVPYSAGLFKAIDASARKFVAIVTPEFGENFKRDWHYEMARVGFLCVEKRTFDAKAERTGRDLSPGDLDGLISVFLFRRIEP